MVEPLQEDVLHHVEGVLMAAEQSVRPGVHRSAVLLKYLIVVLCHVVSLATIDDGRRTDHRREPDAHSYFATLLTATSSSARSRNALPSNRHVTTASDESAASLLSPLWATSSPGIVTSISKAFPFRPFVIS